jgi:hypothetical protein
MIALLWSASICGYSKAPGSIADSTTVYYERPRQQYYQTAAGFDPNMQRYQMNPAYGGNFVEIETTDTPVVPNSRRSQHQNARIDVPARGFVREVIVSPFLPMSDSEMETSSSSSESWGGAEATNNNRGLNFGDLDTESFSDSYNSND